MLVFFMSAKEVCKNVVNHLGNTPEVFAIFNNGSSVVGLNTDHSDLDFVIILRDEKDRRKILSLIRKNFRIIKNNEHPDVEIEEQYDILGSRVDFTLISKKDIDYKINSFYNSIDNFLEFQHFIKHKIIDSVAIYDPKKYLPKWKKIVEKYPKKFMKEVFDSRIRAIKEGLYYWENCGFRNEFQFGFEQWEIMEAICQAIYAKNNRLFMLPYKRVHNDLKELRPNIEKEMYKLVRGVNNPRTIMKKQKIVKKILGKLEK